MNTEHAERVFFKAGAELRGYGDQQTIGEWVALLLTVRVLSDHTHLYPEMFLSSEDYFNETRFPNWDDFKRSYRDAFTSALSDQSNARPLRLLAPILASLLEAKIPDPILTRVIYEFDNLATPFKDLNSLGDACGSLIDQLVLRKSYGDREQFYTSSAAAQLAARLVYLDHAITIHDPSCGYGVALTTYRTLARQGHQRYSGQDINARAVAIATMRLLMYGVSNFELSIGDTLANPYLENKSLPTFDVILSDPPLGTMIANYGALERDPHNRFRYGQPSRRSVEWSFIQHVLASLNPTGIATVLTSAGVLFRGGEEARTRENVIAADFLEAIIALPSGVFASIGIPGYLMVFNTNKPTARHDHVLFIDVSASPPGWGDGIKGQWAAGGFIDYAYSAYRDGESSDGLPTALVSKKTILENDANLSPNRYLSLAAPPVAPTLEQISALQHQAQDAWESLERSRVVAATAWQAVLDKG